MLKQKSITRVVLIAFVLYVVLTGMIMLGFYTETHNLLAEQNKLTEDNQELNEKYEDLLDVLEDYRQELDKRRLREEGR